MTDLAEMIVKLRGLQEGFDQLTHRDDVSNGLLRSQIAKLSRQRFPVIHELDQYLHRNLLEQHLADKNSL